MFLLKCLTTNVSVVPKKHGYHQDAEQCGHVSLSVYEHVSFFFALDFIIVKYKILIFPHCCSIIKLTKSQINPHNKFLSPNSNQKMLKQLKTRVLKCVTPVHTFQDCVHMCVWVFRIFPGTLHPWTTRLLPLSAPRPVNPNNVVIKWELLVKKAAVLHISYWITRCWEGMHEPASVPLPAAGRDGVKQHGRKWIGILPFPSRPLISNAKYSKCHLFRESK